MREGSDFDMFFTREYPAVVRAVFVMTGDRAGAEDLAQEAFARLYSAILAADPDCAPTGGLCDSVLSAIALGFDADGDRAITSDEFMAGFPDQVGQQYLLPDADVLSGGDYWPGHDGDPDCLSVGFTFHGVSAVVADSSDNMP